MSLLFTYPQLTEESSSLLAAAARMTAARYVISFYQIESYHSSSSCGLYSMHFDGTIILLYFIEMLPRMVSHGRKHAIYFKTRGPPQLELFLSEVNNRETITAIVGYNDTYCLQKRIEKFPLTVNRTFTIMLQRLQSKISKELYAVQ